MLSLFMNLSLMFGPFELNRTLQYHNVFNRKIDEIREHRNLQCFFYDLCLKLAACKNWQSFTCKYCPNSCMELHTFQNRASLINAVLRFLSTEYFELVIRTC